MRPSLSLLTTPLTMDEKIAADRMLGQLPGVHHVEWGNRPLPHVNIVYDETSFIDRGRAQQVLGPACRVDAPPA